MQCPQCGVELQDGTPVCPKCGEKLIRTERPRAKGRDLTMPKRNPLHGKIVKTIVILVIIAALAVGFVEFGLPKVQEFLNPGASSSATVEETESTETDPADAGAGSKDANTPTDKAAAAAKASAGVPAISAKDITLTLSYKERAIKLSFSKETAALNYRVAYRASGAKKWSYQWTGGDTSCVVKGLKRGAAYELRVAAYTVDDGKWVRSDYSKSKCGWIQDTTAKVKPGKRSFTVTVATKKDATSYEVLYAGSKNGLAAGKTVKVKGTKATVKSLKRGKTYYVKARPMTAVDGVSAPGIYSQTYKVKVK